jgi:tetratricopeptide (TPR) repeat protein
MRRSAIFAITVVVCACASWAQSLTEAQEHSALAIKLFRQAKFTESEREYRVALDYARALGKAGLPEYSIFLTNLAAVLQSQGRIKEARQALEECVSIEEHSLPQPRGKTLAHALNNLALIVQTDGKLTAAVRLLKRASSLPVDERTRGGTMHNLGAVYFEMGQRKKAEKLFDDAVEIYRRLNSNEELSPALTFVAKIAAEKGDTARAQVLLQEALEIRTRISGPGHPNVALTLADIGEFQLSTKRYDAAIENFERALRIVADSLGADHIYNVAILFLYAQAQQQLGHHEEALATYERTIRILQRTYGPDHPRLAAIYRHAAISSAKLKRKEEAKTYAQRADAIARNTVDWKRHTIDVSAFLPGR